MTPAPVGGGTIVISTPLTSPCESCGLRLKAFAEARAKDSIPYRIAVKA